MASSDKVPGACPARNEDQHMPPGDPITAKTMMIDKGASLIQSLKPINQMSQHLCSFGLYGHDPSRQIETHFYVQRLNQDFLQSAVYDSDSSSAHLIGVEYMVSEKLFNTLPAEEQKLWHSHQYEVQTGLLVTPRFPEVVAMPELQNIAKTYGKFWCTWQVDRGDRLPLGPAALMMSPQDVNMGRIKPELVKKRDDQYGISTEALMLSRGGIEGLEAKNLNADYWVKHGKGFAVDIVETEMKKMTAFP